MDHVVSVEGAPATGKSTLTDGLSDVYSVFPEIPAYTPSSYRQQPRDVTEFRRRLDIELDGITARWKKVDGERPTVLDTSVVSSLGLLSLFAERIEGDVTAELRGLVETVGCAFPSPDHVVCLSADYTDISRRWRARDSNSSFWSSRRVVEYLGAYYRRLAERLPVAVVDTTALGPSETLDRVRDHVSESAAVEPGQLRDALEHAAVDSRPRLSRTAARSAP